MMGPASVILLSMVLGSGSWAATPPGGACKGCNLIVVSLGNVGAAHMSLYGYERRTTPRLEEWSKDAAVFDAVFTHASWTLPVAASLFTSLYPYTHRLASRRVDNRLHEGIPTFPETLARSGYRTAAFTGGVDYDPAFGHMKGFKEVPKNPDFSGFAATLPQAKEWISRNASKRFFVFIHAYDAHCPFQPALPFRGRFGDSEDARVSVNSAQCVRGYQYSDSAYEAEYTDTVCGKDARCRSEGRHLLEPADVDYLRDRYDETVLQVDARAGDFLASLDRELLKKTIILVLSDHGEMFARHGRFGRAGAVRGTLYDDVLHVPLILKLPGEPGRRVSGLAEIIDVMPTLLDLLGIAAPARVQGVSLAPLLRGDASVRSYVHAGLPFYLPDPDGRYRVDTVAEAIRDGRWKLIHEVYISLHSVELRPPAGGEKYELYDMRADPGERADVAGAHPEIVELLGARLREWAGNASRSAPRPVRGAVSKELLRQTRQRGYWDW